TDRTYNHMAVGWTWAFDTPFTWTKQIASHFGGTRQGVAISWPSHITDLGGIRNQFHHIIDIVPTILETTGIPAPAVVNGIPATADGRGEHGLHFRQGGRRCAVDAPHPIFRDDWRPRPLSRWLDRQYKSDPAALGAHRASQPGSIQ